MKERIFTTKEQGRALVKAGLPISTASGYRSSEIDRLYGINKLYSMEDNAGRVSLIEVVTPRRIKSCLGCRYVAEFVSGGGRWIYIRML